MKPGEPYGTPMRLHAEAASASPRTKPPLLSHTQIDQETYLCFTVRMCDRYTINSVELALVVLIHGSTISLQLLSTQGSSLLGLCLIVVIVVVLVNQFF